MPSFRIPRSVLFLLAVIVLLEIILLGLTTFGPLEGRDTRPMFYVLLGTATMTFSFFIAELLGTQQALRAKTEELAAKTRIPDTNLEACRLDLTPQARAVIRHT